MARIGMIGAGSWGTALAAHLARCGHKVEVWSIMKDEVDMINNTHQQSVKLPGVILDETVTADTDLERVMRDKDMLVLAVPSSFTRSTAANMAKYCRYGQLIVSVAKGIEEDSLLTLTEVIKQEIPYCEAAVLCGPTHAEEVGVGLPTAIVAGAARKEPQGSGGVCAVRIYGRLFPRVHKPRYAGNAGRRGPKECHRASSGMRGRTGLR